MRALLIAILLATQALACPPQGDGRNAAQRAQNRLKNRASEPEIATRITVAQLLAPGDDTRRFSSSNGAIVTGYVALVKDGGVESCNCHSATEKDTHIVVTASAADAANGRKHIIVEVTPRFRKQFGTTLDLRHKLLGHTVQFSGWLFFDSEHKQNAANTAPQNKKDWRATDWEVHPVTGIQVMK